MLYFQYFQYSKINRYLFCFVAQHGLHEISHADNINPTIISIKENEYLTVENCVKQWRQAHTNLIDEMHITCLPIILQ